MVLPIICSPFWQILEQSDCMCEICVARCETMVYPRWKNQEIPFGQGAAYPSFILVANLKSQRYDQCNRAGSIDPRESTSSYPFPSMM